MRKYFLLVALCFLHFAIAVPIQDHRIEPMALANLATVLGIPADANIVVETQISVIKGALPNTCQFDLVGPGSDPTSHPAAAAITLDSIARWIYKDHMNGEKGANYGRL